MGRVTCLLIAVAVWIQAQTATKPQIQRKESVTVSAGIPNEQVRFEEACDQKIREAEALAAKGESAKALELLDVAWQMTKSRDYLENRQRLILRNRGRTYLKAQQPDQATLAFQKRLDLEKDECLNAADGVPSANTCADALMDLGGAQVLTGKNSEALKNLLQAADYYRICTKESPATSELARVSYQKFVAEATVIAGIADARMGKRQEAQSLIRDGIKTLEAVVSNPTSSEALKSNASQLLQFARQQESQLK